MVPSQLSPHPWGAILPSPLSPPMTTRSSSICGFVCPPSLARSSLLAMTPLRSTSSTPVATKLHATTKNYSAEWIDLLSPASYHSSTPPSLSLPGIIDPPRSGAVSFTTPANDQLYTFAGYAEIASSTPEEAASPERFVVNDLWKFVPYSPSEEEETSSSSWGWTKVSQSEVDYVPGPRLATALAVLPSSSSENSNDHPQAVLLGGWDPQTPGTGGVILDDVAMLDLESLQWSKSTAEKEEEATTVPGGPTSRHVAVPLSLQEEKETEDIRQVICLHNHRCDDHVLLLSTTTATSDERGNNKLCTTWEHQPTTGDAPSSRGLHCAAPLNTPAGTSKAMVLFGGAAKDGFMSNESFVLDARTWKWTKLDCEGDDADSDEVLLPAPRAGACLCPLDENSVLLFGGATPGDGGLLGLNDVWVLNVDVEHGTGKWTCLVDNRQQSGGDAGMEDGIVRPPGRNAHTLSRIDAKKMLPKELVSKDGDGADSVYYLLQGGWYPFRKTYNDVFLLRIDAKKRISREE